MIVSLLNAIISVVSSFALSVLRAVPAPPVSFDVQPWTLRFWPGNLVVLLLCTQAMVSTLSAVVVYQLANWVYRHIPIVGGG